ncbi:hypothetical protein RFB14_02765 [Brevibacillus borstelensis]|nr:hypothetical protein [Brevibacillus borstelensis]WNF06381.1 hypothetical protein RFB14_02765 [Brevibacillus borstelensis]
MTLNGTEKEARSPAPDGTDGRPTPGNRATCVRMEARTEPGEDREGLRGQPHGALEMGAPEQVVSARVGTGADQGPQRVAAEVTQEVVSQGHNE